MGRLTTHVLDTANGRPGSGIVVEVFHAGSAADCLARAITDSDGRCARPLLEGEAFMAGEYQLVFHAGEYYRGLGMAQGEPAFLDRVVVRFGVSDPTQHYHVPLLLSPFGYSTYRGS
jgi:5-hydroxyisourate hydrolase